MTIKRTTYEENLILHSENARLRKRIEAFESGKEYEKIIGKYEKALAKSERTQNRLRKESDKYHQLWRNALKQLRNMERNCGFLELDIKELNETIANKEHETDNLRNQLAERDAVIQKMRAQINRDFNNSSIPSSQCQNHKVISNSRKKTDRKPGAQAGHKGHGRREYTPDEIVHLDAPETVINSDEYYKTDNQLKRRLVELMVTVKTTEYVADVYRSRITGSRIHADFPEGVVNEINYGKSVKAVACMLNGYCNVSIRKVQELLKEHYLKNCQQEKSICQLDASQDLPKSLQQTPEKSAKAYMEIYLLHHI